MLLMSCVLAAAAVTDEVVEGVFFLTIDQKHTLLDIDEFVPVSMRHCVLQANPCRRERERCNDRFGLFASSQQRSSSSARLGGNEALTMNETVIRLLFWFFGSAPRMDGEMKVP